MILTVAPAKMAAALYEVSESRISRVERHIANLSTKQLNKLTRKETILDYVNKLCFDEKNHDLSDV